MVKVGLQGVGFYAYHGFYPEEQVLGGKFVLDIETSFLQQHHFTNDEIGYTINYEQLYNIADKHMRLPRKLLETVVQAIIDEVKVTFPMLETIRVSLKKLNPPLPGAVACSFIEITYHKPDGV